MNYNSIALSNVTNIPYELYGSTALERNLDDWAKKATLGEYRYEAAEKILDAIMNSSKSLKLSNLNLTSLPDAMCNLVCLEELDLSHNQLTTVPKAIGSLVSLKVLHLSCNQLTTLPDEIGDLVSLEELNLWNNQLREVPNTIVNLRELKALYLSKNMLRNLPNEIGALTSLEELLLAINHLTSIPSSIGRLLALRQLDIQDNPALDTLPLSLESCSQLSYIDNQGTSIPEDQILNFQIQWRTKRLNLSEEETIAKIFAWQNLANVFFSLPERENLPKVYEWLHRLERTKDYTTNYQKDVAEIAMQLLQAACEDPNFSPLFYDQIVANAENCQDRAAMGLNELYTAWKMHLGGSFKDMAAALKTDALRKELARRIRQLPSREESVHIYLYYELAMSRFYEEKHPQEIAPLTFIKTMSYEIIGMRDFDLNELYQHIEAHYLDGILDYPAFEAILDKDEEFKKRFSEMEFPEESMEAYKAAKLSLAKEIMQKKIKG